MNGREGRENLGKCFDINNYKFGNFYLFDFISIIKYIRMMNQSKGPKIYKKGKTNQ